MEFFYFAMVVIKIRYMQIMGLLQRGNMERTQEPTKANQTSSRSHAVLQITVKQRSRTRGTNSQVNTTTIVSHFICLLC